MFKRRQSHKNNYAVSEHGKLSHDVLIIIFQYLSIYDRVRCQRVCKQWKEAIKASFYNFKCLDSKKDTWGENINRWPPRYDAFRPVLRLCGEALTSIDFSEFPPDRYYGDKISASLTQTSLKCPNLKHVNLTSVRVGTPELRVLAFRCQKIETLVLADTTPKCNDHFFETEVFYYLKLLRSFEMRNPSSKTFTGSCLSVLSPDVIEEISLISCPSINYKLLATILPKFKKLATLRIILKSGEEDLHHSVLVSSLKELTSLKCLDLSKSYDRIQNRDLVSLRNLVNTLVFLDVSACFITDSGLKYITTSTSLEHLHIREIRNINGRGLGTGMPNLKTLDCSFSHWIEGNYIIDLLNGSERLELLNLKMCQKIKANFVESVKNVLKYRKSDIELKILLQNTGVIESEVTTMDSPLLKLEFK